MSRPDVDTFGITNETEDNHFLVFADYDNVAYRKVLKDIDFIAEAFDLCTFVILENSSYKTINKWKEEEEVGNYNVICLDKLPFATCERAISYLRCDRDFKEHVWLYPQRNRVIRIGSKMQGKKLIKGNPKLKIVIQKSPMLCRRMHSRPHLDILKEFFGISLSEIALDDNKLVEVVKYSTQVKNKGGNSNGKNGHS